MRGVRDKGMVCVWVILQKVVSASETWEYCNQANFICIFLFYSYWKFLCGKDTAGDGGGGRLEGMDIKPPLDVFFLKPTSH